MGDDRREIALEARTSDAERLFSPSVARNRDVIVETFLANMPSSGEILEIGAGTGEHAIALAAALPEAHWRPGDPDPASRASITAWAKHQRLSNIADTHHIDVSKSDWAGITDASLVGIVSINMIHIAPFAAATGLFAGAERYLDQAGHIFLYGPFSRSGEHTSPTNEAFDASLKSRNPDWGVRDLDLEILPIATRHGLGLKKVVPMPANNFAVIFGRTL